MTIILPLMIYVCGVLVAALLTRALRQRIPEAIAYGIGALPLVLSLYPLMLWLTDQQYQAATFLVWAGWCAAGAVVATAIYASLRR